MEFEAHATIHRPLEDVFEFFRDIHQQPRREGSVVPVFDKITPGLVGVGIRFREVVRLLPFLRGEVILELTGYNGPCRRPKSLHLSSILPLLFQLQAKYAPPFTSSTTPVV